MSEAVRTESSQSPPPGGLSSSVLAASATLAVGEKSGGSGGGGGDKAAAVAWRHCASYEQQEVINNLREILQMRIFTNDDVKIKDNQQVLISVGGDPDHTDTLVLEGTASLSRSLLYDKIHNKVSEIVSDFAMRVHFAMRKNDLVPALELQVLVPTPQLQAKQLWQRAMWAMKCGILKKIGDARAMAQSGIGKKSAAEEAKKKRRTFAPLSKYHKSINVPAVDMRRICAGVPAVIVVWASWDESSVRFLENNIFVSPEPVAPESPDFSNSKSEMSGAEWKKASSAATNNTTTAAGGVPKQPAASTTGGVEMTDPWIEFCDSHCDLEDDYLLSSPNVGGNSLNPNTNPGSSGRGGRGISKDRSQPTFKVKDTFKKSDFASPPPRDERHGSPHSSSRRRSTKRKSTVSAGGLAPPHGRQGRSPSTAKHVVPQNHRASTSHGASSARRGTTAVHHTPQRPQSRSPTANNTSSTTTAGVVVAENGVSRGRIGDDEDNTVSPNSRAMYHTSRNPSPRQGGGGRVRLTGQLMASREAQRQGKENSKNANSDQRSGARALKRTVRSRNIILVSVDNNQEQAAKCLEGLRLKNSYWTSRKVGIHFLWVGPEGLHSDFANHFTIPSLPMVLTCARPRQTAPQMASGGLGSPGSLGSPFSVFGASSGATHNFSANDVGGGAGSPLKHSGRSGGGDTPPPLTKEQEEDIAKGMTPAVFFRASHEPRVLVMKEPNAFKLKRKSVMSHHGRYGQMTALQKMAQSEPWHNFSEEERTKVVDIFKKFIKGTDAPLVFESAVCMEHEVGLPLDQHLLGVSAGSTPQSPGMASLGAGSQQSSQQSPSTASFGGTLNSVVVGHGAGGDSPGGVGAMSLEQKRFLQHQKYYSIDRSSTLSLKGSSCASSLAHIVPKIQELLDTVRNFDFDVLIFEPSKPLRIPLNPRTAEHNVFGWVSDVHCTECGRRILCDREHHFQCLQCPRSTCSVCPACVEAKKHPQSHVLAKLHYHTEPCLKGTDHTPLIWGPSNVAVLPTLQGKLVSSVSNVHVGVYCNACLTPIQGVRYKCMMCHDVDLCEICEKSWFEKVKLNKGDRRHPTDHIFMRIPLAVPGDPSQILIPTPIPLEEVEGRVDEVKAIAAGANHTHALSLKVDYLPPRSGSSGVRNVKPDANTTATSSGAVGGSSHSLSSSGVSAEKAKHSTSSGVPTMGDSSTRQHLRRVSTVLGGKQEKEGGNVLPGRSAGNAANVRPVPPSSASCETPPPRSEAADALLKLLGTGPTTNTIGTSGGVENSNYSTGSNALGKKRK